MYSNELSAEVRKLVNSWEPKLTYYMENENVPKERTEELDYYRQARTYLSDRLVEMWIVVRRYTSNQQSTDDVNSSVMEGEA